MSSINKDAAPSPASPARRPKKLLAPSVKYEIWLQLVRAETTINAAAEAAGVDRSTIMKLRQVAKQGALAALQPDLGPPEAGVRYPILLCVLAQAAVDLLDEVVALFDRAVLARESRAKTKMEQAMADRARTGEDRQQLLKVVLWVLADESIPDEAVGGLLRDQLGRQNLGCW